jgi:hypothetical protein
MDNERRERMIEALEAAFGRSLGAGSAEGNRPNDGAAPMGSPVVLGAVVDTHHPHLPGRVLVRWWEDAETERSEWLSYERHLSLYREDRVLVTLPIGGSEWIVTGALGRPTTGGPAIREAAVEAGADPSASQPTQTEAPPASEARSLRLDPGQNLVIVAHDGAPLIVVRRGEEGVVVELQRDDVDINVRRRLRLSANTIEIAAGSGGVDVRTDGDAITRARAIRLN